jgi:dCMP deaminase
MSSSVDAAGKVARGHEVPSRADPRQALPRIGQVEWDHYYMQIALTVRTRANCTGSQVGAVLVRDNRIISTGFNGTPQGFMNCKDGGCVRCRDRAMRKVGRMSEISYPDLSDDEKHLDLCICVHAEANALLSAARAGMRTDDTSLYANYKPCFSCLKEAVQAGVTRVVYLHDWVHSPHESLVHQYTLLAEHLRRGNERNFERLARQRGLIDGTATEARSPDLDDLIESSTPEATAAAAAATFKPKARTKKRPSDDAGPTAPSATD